MKTIAFVASKGGVGKSTLASHTAVCAARAGQIVAAIDLDPQRSLAKWGQRRELDDVTVTDARIQEVPTMLANAKRQGADLLIFDSAGRKDTVADQLTKIADLIIIPIRPGIYDLEACAETARLLARENAQSKSWFILNACPSSASRITEAFRALEPLDVPTCPHCICNRVDFVDALTAGLSVFELNPGGKAAHEISKFYRWLLRV